VNQSLKQSKRVNNSCFTFLLNPVLTLYSATPGSILSNSPRKRHSQPYHEIANETSINLGKNFMDEYYASNGYFSFSCNREEMRGKDVFYDRLQTFVDERLLEITSQISVKQRAEDKKIASIDKLAGLKEDIGKRLMCNLE